MVTSFLQVQKLLGQNDKLSPDNLGLLSSTTLVTAADGIFTLKIIYLQISLTQPALVLCGLLQTLF